MWELYSRAGNQHPYSNQGLQEEDAPGCVPPGLEYPQYSTTPLATSSCVWPLHRNNCYMAHTWRYSATPTWFVSCLPEMTQNNSAAPSQCPTEVLQQTSYDSTGNPAGAWGLRHDICHTISRQDTEREEAVQRGALVQFSSCSRRD